MFRVLTLLLVLILAAPAAAQTMQISQVQMGAGNPVLRGEGSLMTLRPITTSAAVVNLTTGETIDTIFSNELIWALNFGGATYYLYSIRHDRLVSEGDVIGESHDGGLYTVRQYSIDYSAYGLGVFTTWDLLQQP